ncbi:hypothetical protein [Burkholderia semiarida]|uniref:hypothetical protein n=1 Tax=Burkholderia semiarida TaxID=2843303 RepID=UPI0037504289
MTSLACAEPRPRRTRSPRRIERQAGQRLQDERGHAPDVPRLIRPIPAAGTFAVRVLPRQIRIQQRGERELENFLDFGRRDRTWDEYSPSPDDRLVSRIVGTRRATIATRTAENSHWPS